MAAGGYRKGTGPKSTLAKKVTPKKDPSAAPSVNDLFQARAEQQFDQIMATWEAKAFGTLIAVYDLKEIKGKNQGEVSGGVDQHGVPVYVYRKEPETRALEFVTEHLMGKAATKQTEQVDNVFILNHDIPRPIYDPQQPKTTPPLETDIPRPLVDGEPIQIKVGIANPVDGDCFEIPALK